MKEYSAWQYLLIDVANNNGLDTDKEVFEARIAWTEARLSSLEDFAVGKQWKQRPLYLKAVQAVRKAQAGIPTGHVVGLDAVCSGLQLMSVAMGCEIGAAATGLVDPGRRADAYTECSAHMSNILGYHIPNERKKVKNSLMTALYGSRKEPEQDFGKDTPELAAFWQAMQQVAPGACQLLELLVNSWRPWALEHSWHLPDGFYSRVKVIQKEKKRIEVDELDHATFTYEYYINEGEEKGVKNAPNVVHSIDAWILRNMIRRCNYDQDMVERASVVLEAELLRRALGDTSVVGSLNQQAYYYLSLYGWFGIADPVILPHLDAAAASHMTEEHLRGLARIVNSMLEHPPFPLLTIHDCFAAHPNNLNQVRKHYRNILAELADSSLIDRILSQLYGTPVTVPKLSTRLGTLIRQSAYGLC